jgi:Glycosyltransferase (GlcNAc)
MAIFVSIASYCDPLLRATVESARDNARHPDKLHFGIVDQSALPYEAPTDASYVRIDPAQARGPCWARAIAMTFYRGEDWFLQIDSHMDFERDWDERLASQAAALAPNRKGVVLTTYPNPFVLEEGKPVRKPVTQGVLALIVKKGTSFTPGQWTLPFEGVPVDAAAPIAGFHVGAGCLFATGRFAIDFPYDPAIYFHGEEQSIALRVFTAGWDIFHPPGMPIYHLYTTKETTALRDLHWDADHDAARNVKWTELENRSRQRLAQLVDGAPLGAYGIGSVRTIADFAAFSGIDYSRRHLAPRAFEPFGMRSTPTKVSMTVATVTGPRTKWGS